MNEKIRKLKMQEIVKTLFSGGYLGVFREIGPKVGLIDDKEFDEVMRYLEIEMEIHFDAAAEAVYEKCGANEAMILWEDSKHMTVMINHGNRVTLHKYRVDNLEQEVAIPSDALLDVRDLIKGMREDLDKLLKAQPENLELLDDYHAEMDGTEEETPDDVDSLDEPRIHGEE